MPKSMSTCAVSAAKYGRKVIAHKMKEKGLDEDLVDNALFDHNRRNGKGYRLSPYKNVYGHGMPAIKTAQKKIFNALFRRGFDYGIITALLSGDDGI